MTYIAFGVRVFFGALFLIAAATKTRRRDAWRSYLVSVAGLTTLKRGGRIRAVAMTAVAGEAAVPILMLFPTTIPWGFALSALLLCGFSTAAVLTLRRGDRQECRCFGGSAETIRRSTVVRNGVLLTVLLCGALAWRSAAPVPLDAGWAVLTGVVAATLLGAVLYWRDIADLVFTTDSRSLRGIR